MSLDDVEDSMKVIVVGNGNVGKTSMLRRFVKGTFTEQYKKTIGAEYLEKEVYVKELKQSLTLMLWDTAGQEVFNALTSGYYRGAAAAVLAFSTIDKDSFMSIKKWREKVESQCGKIITVLCQTKCDLSDQASVSKAEADRLAASMKLPFFRISTKDDYNVAPMFEYVAKRCLSGDSVLGGDAALSSMQAAPPSSDGESAVPPPAAPDRGKKDSDDEEEPLRKHSKVKKNKHEESEEEEEPPRQASKRGTPEKNKDEAGEGEDKEQNWPKSSSKSTQSEADKGTSKNQTEVEDMKADDKDNEVEKSRKDKDGKKNKKNKKDENDDNDDEDSGKSGNTNTKPIKLGEGGTKKKKKKGVKGLAKKCTIM